MTSEYENLIESPKESGQGREFSLRSRIMLATTATAVLAVLAVGLFTFFRNNATQTRLGNRFQNSVQQKSESELLATVLLEAQGFNQFFQEVSKSVSTTATYTAKLLDNEAFIDASKYWNAADEVYRYPGTGAWANSNNDLGAIFAPSFIEIDEQLGKELNSIIQLDLSVPNLLLANPNIIAMYYISKNEITLYYPNNNLAVLVPPDFKATDQQFYKIGAKLNKGNTAWSLPYQDPAQTGLIVSNSSPVFDKFNNLRGVVGADMQLDLVRDRVEALEAGVTGYAFMIDSEGHIIAMPPAGFQDLNITPEIIRENETPQLNIMNEVSPEIRLVFQSMAQGGNGLARVKLNETEYYLAYAPILSPKYSLGLMVPVSEMTVAVQQAQTLAARENQQTQTFGLLLLLIAVVAAFFVSFVISQVLTTPLNQLTETAEQVSAGNLTARAPITTVSEVNVLAKAFNTMTTQLRSTLGGLEERVEERTAELETAHQESQRRAAQFEAIAQVAREISTSQDLESLLPKITHVVSEKFGFYHVGIFLLDSRKDFAVLRAANSSGGQKMLAREHRLKVGETGLVGYATNRGKARIALDTGADAVYFDNPDLPDTRSEMALPIIVGGEIIGALDVQSTEPDAFSQDDIETLSTLADQAGIAIHNARLYEETSNALVQAQVLSQQITSVGWSQFKQSKKIIGIRRSKDKSTLLNEPLADKTNGKNTLTLPVILRGQNIGSLKVNSTDKHSWAQDEIDIASAILERAAIAMENARLLSEAQRRANRELIISEISTSVGSSTDIEDILRNAVQELGRRMGGAEVVLELGHSPDNEKLSNE